MDRLRPLTADPNRPRAVSLPRAAFHETMARLAVGDLHPGGSHASNFLLAQLAEPGVRRVLEVGAGIGHTSARLLRSGFAVTPLEPNPILRATLKARLGVEASSASFGAFGGRDGEYDAIVGESVFYALNLTRSFAEVRRLVRPGGLFAFAEMLWTDVAKPDVVAFIHDQTKTIFGIAMAPRTAITWEKWGKTLFEVGFRQVVEQRVDPHIEREEEARANRAVRVGLCRRPWLLPQYLTYRLYGHLSWAPPGWLESRMGVWRRT